MWKEAADERTSFFYTDEGLVAEYDAEGNELASYGYRPDSTWTTDPLWQKRDGEYYFYQNDHLGTPQKLVKQNGAVVWSASYTAFGQATLEIEEITNNLRFPGQYFDEETGLHYNFHRYYAPGIGRYVKKDPAGLSGGIHLLVYVKNNPLTYIDPNGLIGIIAPAIALPEIVGAIGLFCFTNPVGAIACPVIAAVATLVVFKMVVNHIILPCIEDISVWWQILMASQRGTSDYPTEIEMPRVLPLDRDDTEGCPPCPPDLPRFHDHGKPVHGCKGNLHVHLWTYNQDPITCTCYRSKDPEVVCL